MKKKCKHKLEPLSFGEYGIAPAVCKYCGAEGIINLYF